MEGVAAARRLQVGLSQQFAQEARSIAPSGAPVAVLTLLPAAAAPVAAAESASQAGSACPAQLLQLRDVASSNSGEYSSVLLFVSGAAGGATSSGGADGGAQSSSLPLFAASSVSSVLGEGEVAALQEAMRCASQSLDLTQPEDAMIMLE